MLEHDTTMTAPPTTRITGRAVLDAISTGALPPPPAAELLRLDLEVVGDGETVFGFHADPSFGNPGSVHGGILAAVADFAVTTAIWTRVAVEAEIVTADLHVSYLRGVRLDGARYHCRGEVLRLGRSQANAIATVTAEDGTTHVYAVATCRIRTTGRDERAEARDRPRTTGLLAPEER